MKKLRVVMLVSVVTMVATLGVSVAPESAKADLIRKGETKSYWVAPAGSLTIYYYPNGNNPSVLDAQILWYYTWLGDPPQATVDIYSSSMSSSKWYWMYRMYVKPRRRTSPRLYLTRRVYKHKFEIRSSDLARVTLRLR